MSGLAEEELERGEGSRRWRIAGGWLLTVGVVVALAFLLKDLGGSGPTPQRQITKITVLPDTPPPPPPPPKEEPKKPKEAKEVKLEQPKPVQIPHEAPQLKMEGPAGEGGSPFVAGAVKQDYIGGQAGGGRGGLQHAFFSNALQRHIQEELARNRKVKLGDYRVTVNIWIADNGSIRRAELTSSTGSPATDDALRAAFADIGPIRSSVPDNLPQPIKLRITNRLTG